MSSGRAGLVPRWLLLGGTLATPVVLLAQAACGELGDLRLSAADDTDQLARGGLAAADLIDPAIILRTGLGPTHRRRPEASLEGVRIVPGAGINLVLWYEGGPPAGDPRGAIRAIRVRASDGAVLGPGPLVVNAHDRGAADAAFDGLESFLIAYEASGRFQGGGIHARRIRAADGMVLDEPDLEVSPAGTSADSPAVAFGDGRFLVVWRNSTGIDTNISGRFLSTTGSTTSPSDMPIAVDAAPERLPVVCFTAGYFIVVYQTRVASRFEIRAWRVRGSDGAVLDQSAPPVATSLVELGPPRCASDGAGFVVTWDPGPEGLILGRRIDAASGLAAGPLVTLARGRSPRVVWDGNSAFLLLWSDPRGVYLRRLAADPLGPLDGPIDTGGLPIAASTTASVGAEDLGVIDSTALITWQRYGSTRDLLAARVRVSDGALLDSTPQSLAFTADPQSDAAVAYASGVYLVAWFDRRGPDGFQSPTDLLGARIRASDGALLDPLGLSLIEDVAQPEGPPAIATDGSGFLVATMRATAANTADLLARRILADGSLPDPAPLRVLCGMTTNGVLGPKVTAAAASGRYVIAWPHFASDPSLGIVSREIHAQRIDAASGMLVGQPIVVGFSGSNLCTEPSVACERQTCLVAWLDGDDRQRTAYNIFGGRLNAFTGAALDSTPIHLDERPGNPRNPHFAVDLTERSGSYFAVWTEFSGRGLQLVGRPLGADASILGSPVTTLGSSCSADLRSVSASFDGNQILAFCSGRRSTVFSRLRPPGTLLDRAMRLVDTTSLSVSRPRSTSDGAGRTLAVHTRFDLEPGMFTTRVVADLFDPRADGGQLDAAPVLDASLSPLDASPPVLDASPPIDARMALDGHANDSPAAIDSAPSSDAAEPDGGVTGEDAAGSEAADSGTTPPGLEPLDPGPTSCGCKTADPARAPREPYLVLALALFALRRRAGRRSTKRGDS